MNCNLCNESLGSNTIKYKCGHIFHKCCLLPKIMSILNPDCKICNNGKIDGYPSDKEEDDEVDDEEDDDEEDHDEEDHEDDEVDDEEDVDEDEVDDKEDELTRHEKIILCEIVLFGLSLVSVIVGIIYR